MSGDHYSFDDALIERSKIVTYLLGETGHASIAKARFFRAVGFAPDRWDALAAALRQQARRSPLTVVTTAWGTKVIAIGPIDAPNGRLYKLISVWIDEVANLRFVTAYPFKEPPWLSAKMTRSY